MRGFAQEGSSVIMSFLNLLTSILGNANIKLAIIAFSFTCKLPILFMCFKNIEKARFHQLSYYLFTLFLSVTLFEDGCHLISHFARNILLMKGFIPSITFLIRINWAFFITHYQAIALFLEHLTTKKIKVTSLFNLITFLVNGIVSSIFLYIAFFYYYPVPALPGSPNITFYEVTLTQICYAYLPFLFAPKFYVIYKKVKSKEIPTIVNYQLRYLISLLIPYLILETINSKNSYLGRPFFSSLALPIRSSFLWLLFYVPVQPIL